MALAQGAPTSLSLATTTQTVQTIKFDTDLAVTLYAESNDLRARVIDVSSGAISEGAEQDVWSGLVSSQYCAATASTTQIVVAGDPSGAGTRARTMTISGTTITENATDLLDSDSNPESVRIAMATATLGLVAYRIGGGTTTARVCRITISGTTITSGSPTALTGAGDDHDIITMCALDTTRIFLVYSEESTANAMAVVIDITSGVSIGTPVQLDTDATISLVSTGVFTCTKVDTDKIAVGFVDTSESPDQPAAIIVTTSGTTIASQGTRYSVISAVADCEVHSIEAIDTSTLTIAYTPSVSGNVDIETLGVSGTTISASSDTVTTDSGSDGSKSTSVAMIDSTKAIFSIIDGALDTEVSIITGFDGPSELRYLGLASDETNLYITYNEANTLKHKYYDLATLTAQTVDLFGAATYAEIDSNTYGVYPARVPNNQQKVYLRGRDGNDLQTQYNDLNGTLGWVDVGQGTATWGTAKFAVALMIDTLWPNDAIIAFSDNDIYQTTQGTINWAKMGDAPTDLRAGMRISLSNNEMLLGGTAAGTVHYTPNYGVTFGVASDASLGTINWFEESR